MFDFAALPLPGPSKLPESNLEANMIGVSCRLPGDSTGKLFA